MVKWLKISNGRNIINISSIQDIMNGENIYIQFLNGEIVFVYQHSNVTIKNKVFQVLVDSIMDCYDPCLDVQSIIDSVESADIKY